MAKRATSIYRHSFNKQQIQKFLAVILVVIVSTSMLFVETRYASDHDLLRVWMFDVGQGDAIFIETPTGEQMLIDTGPSREVLSKLGTVMLPWDKTIDALVLTHADADHISGAVSVLDKYDVTHIYNNGIDVNTPIANAVENAVLVENAVSKAVRAGDTIQLGNATLEVIWPSSSAVEQFSKERNNMSVVLKLIYGNSTILLTGDLEKEGEAAIQNLVGDIDVLKVGHHGSVTSSTRQFLDAINPEVAIFPVGENNRYNHPHPAVVKRFIDREIEIYRTDFDGDILLVSDGKQIEVESRPLPF